MMKSSVAFAFTVVGLLPTAIAACNRTQLLKSVEDYKFGLENGQAGPVGQDGNIASNFTYIENNKLKDITTGVMFNILVLNHTRTIVDPVQCATYSEIIVANPAKPFVIGTIIRHDLNSMDIHTIDSIVSTNGSWLFNATNTLYWASREEWGTLPETDRSGRANLQAAADAYLDMWHNRSAIDNVPWGTPCARLEGGAYTGTGAANDTCRFGLPAGTDEPITDRRYVIDEEISSVVVFSSFTFLDGAPDSHEFRLERGKLRYVHTITVPLRPVVMPGGIPTVPPGGPE